MMTLEALAMLRGINPATGEKLDPPIPASTIAELDDACRRAEEAFDAFREIGLAARADFLEAVADEITALGDPLIVTCTAETGLPRGRIEGERTRTMDQLRLFAGVVRSGQFTGVRVDAASPAHPDIRMRMIPLGPVAVFGASNFPLAFSVAGGDTASALAAGCPVIVKAHPAHPATADMVGRAIARAVERSGMPEGCFSILFDDGHEIGAALVADPRIKAVGFTGSRGGGLALLRIAQARAEPIPVYAEMSAVNPVLLLPGALARRGQDIGREFAASLTLGAGQFCTNPGLLIAIEGDALDSFAQAAVEALGNASPAVMLSPQIAENYRSGVNVLEQSGEVVALYRGSASEGCRTTANLFATSARAFLNDARLQDEIFGATALLVRCRDESELFAVLEQLEGQLVGAIHLDDGDHGLARRSVAVLERKVGRIVINAFGTGVAVTHAMVHGGPFPATSDSRTTSVGSLAIERFLRPVCYQGFPAELLPEMLVDAGADS